MTDKNITVIDVLKAARSKICSHDNWIRGIAAATDDGDWVEPSHPEACKWCASGAVRSVFPQYQKDNRIYRKDQDVLLNFANNRDRHMFFKTVGILTCLTWCNDLIKYNDDENTNHKDIINLFDRAIAAYVFEPQWQKEDYENG